MTRIKVQSIVKFIQLLFSCKGLLCEEGKSYITFTFITGAKLFLLPCSQGSWLGAAHRAHGWQLRLGILQ